MYHYNFVLMIADDSPPTLLVRVPTGSSSVEPNGDIAVFPGSIVHLECAFSRKHGNPEWKWTSQFREYLAGRQNVLSNFNNGYF